MYFHSKAFLYLKWLWADPVTISRHLYHGSYHMHSDRQHAEHVPINQPGLYCLFLHAWTGHQTICPLSGLLNSHIQELAQRHTVKFSVALSGHTKTFAATRRNAQPHPLTTLSAYSRRLPASGNGEFHQHDFGESDRSHRAFFYAPAIFRRYLGDTLQMEIRVIAGQYRLF